MLGFLALKNPSIIQYLYVEMTVQKIIVKYKYGTSLYFYKLTFECYHITSMSNPLMFKS